jgi:chromosome segregation ATPase
MENMNVFITRRKTMKQLGDCVLYEGVWLKKGVVIAKLQAEIDKLNKQELSSRVWKKRVDEAADIVEAQSAEIEKLKSGNEALRADNDAKARVICDELDIDKELKRLKRKIIELQAEIADYKNKLNASMLDASLKAKEIERLKRKNNQCCATIGLLNSMILSGERHTLTSETAIKHTLTSETAIKEALKETENE